MGTFFPAVQIQIDRDHPSPIYRQITDQVRSLILDGSIPPGTKIPSHRNLAEILAVSRNTAVTAVSQLVTEGYITSIVGSGSYVSNLLPDQFLESSKLRSGQTKVYQENEGLSPRGSALVDGYNPTWHMSQMADHNLFRNGLPDRDSFPINAWEKISRKYLFYQNHKIFDFSDHPAGYQPLRDELANYLNNVRAVNCEMDQVMIVSATEKVIYLAALLLSSVDQKVWLEEPGFPAAARAFKAAGQKIVPICVDEHGLKVDEGKAKAPDAKLVYVSPSHQFPIGSTLSLRRRMELLQWAEQNNAWIIEDDYDSEYRYNHRPLPSLQGLDQYDRVIYCGSFNLTLFPGIRLDYAVVPRRIINSLLTASTILDIHLPTQNQAIIADFISEGFFSRHIRKMRRIYHRRRDILLQTLHDHPSHLISPGLADCGVFITLFLSDHIDDEQVFQEAARIGIETLPLSRLYYGERKKMGLVLGYASCKSTDIRWGIHKIIEIVEEIDSSGPQE